MNKQLRALASLLMFATLPAAAQQHTGSPAFFVRLPAGVHLFPVQAARISQKLSQLSFGRQHGLSQRKTAVSEQLLAMSVYDFTAAPGQQFTDSLRFIYDSSHGSAYDYNSLAYDLDNNGDYPYNSVGFLPATGYVNYDTVRSYVPPGSSSYVNTGIRLYNFLNKVTSFERPTNPDATYFEYDPFGKLIKSTVLDNSNGVGLDSSYRDFYSYNPVTGFIEKDSSQTWNGASWQPEAVITIANNAAGFPVQENVFFSTPMGNIPYASLNLGYYVSNQLASATLRAVNTFPGALKNYSKDTFAYTTGMITTHDTYMWDTTANVWVINSLERRHLNTSALVDTLFTRYYSSTGVPTDSIVQKLVYNSNDHPTLQAYYSGNGVTKIDESRYYYTLPVPAGVKQVKMDIGVYPNPVTDALSVRGLNAGRFSIVNTAGQPVVKGNLLQNARISLRGIPAGVYQLIVQDATGIIHSASFVKE